MASAPDTGDPHPAEPNDGVSKRRTLTRGGRRISYLDAAPVGPPKESTERRVVLLLHGFPDAATMWSDHMARLSAAGLRVIAPDTIGCGDSDVPGRRRDYRVQEILADLVALLDEVGAARVDVVGHDWGSALAWFLTAYHPERVRRLVAISVGHPTSYARAGVDQKIRAWYILYFLLAGLAERGLRRGPGRLGWSGWGRAHPRIAEVRDRMTDPARVTAALRIYRANMMFVLLRTHPRVSVPVLGVWSSGDDYLTEGQMLGSRRFVDGPWRYTKLSGGHWVPLDQPDRTAELVLSHIS